MAETGKQNEDIDWDVEFADDPDYQAMTAEQRDRLLSVMEKMLAMEMAIARILIDTAGGAWFGRRGRYAVGVIIAEMIGIFGRRDFPTPRGKWSQLR